MKVQIFAAVFIVMMAAACMAAESPDQIVKNFYTKYFEMKPDGLPDQTAMKALSPFLSGRLMELFESARKYRDDYATRHPDEKPPFVEGCLFSSSFEGPTSFEIGRTEKLPDGKSKVFVRFSYVDQERPSDVMHWEDAVIVTTENKRLVIEDILYLGEWPFKTGERLSEVLQARD